MLKLFRIKSHIETSNSFSIYFASIFEVVEIITQLFSNFVLRQRTQNARFLTKFFVQAIGLLQGGVVLRLEDVIIGFDEIEKDVRLQHHFQWPVTTVIVFTHTQIYSITMLRNCSQLKINLVQQSII